MLVCLHIEVKLSLSGYAQRSHPLAAQFLSTWDSAFSEAERMGSCATNFSDASLTCVKDVHRRRSAATGTSTVGSLRVSMGIASALELLLPP